MEKNIFEINEITCIAYGKKNPQYLLLQPVNEPHSQMLDQQIRFMTEHTEKSFLLVSFLVKDWNQDLSPWCAPAVFRKEDFGKGAGETLAFIEKMLIPEIGRRYGLEENIKDDNYEIKRNRIYSGDPGRIFPCGTVCPVERLPGKLRCQICGSSRNVSVGLVSRMAGIYENKTDTNEKGISQPGRP